MEPPKIGSDEHYSMLKDQLDKLKKTPEDNVLLGCKDFIMVVEKGMEVIKELDLVRMTLCNGQTERDNQRGEFTPICSDFSLYAC